MKKLLAILLVAIMAVSAMTVFVSAEGENFDYVRVVATGNDPYAEVYLSQEINPDEVKYSVIKYRTNTEVDTTGVKLIGQIYVSPAAEPFIPVIYEHTKQWETVIVDMTTVSESTELASRWNSTTAATFTSIRFDPMESNRDAEAQDAENDEARVSDGDSIDIAYIAFFKSTEDAQAYIGSANEGTATGCEAIIDAFELSFMASNSCNNITAELVSGTGAATTEAPAATTEAPAATTEAPAATTEAPAATTEAPAGTEAPEASTAASDPAPADKAPVPVWLWIVIGVAAVAIVVIIVVAIPKKK